MKKEELIKLGVSDEVAESIISAYSEEIKGFVAVSELDTIKAENEKLNAIIADRDKQLESLKKSVGDNEELKATIKQLEADNKTAKEKYSADIKHIKVENAIETAIRDSRGRNAKAVRALLDIDEDKISVTDDGSLVGFDVVKQLEKLVSGEDSSFLFESGSGIQGIEPAKGVEDKGGFPENGNYEDMVAYLEANPEYKL